MTIATNENVALATGYLTFEQVIAQLFPGKQDGMLLLKRLVARRAIPVVKLGNARRIRLEDVKVFLDGFADVAPSPGQNSINDLRRKLDLPTETINPLIDFYGNDFKHTDLNWQADELGMSIHQELCKQLPSRVVERGATDDPEFLLKTGGYRLEVRPGETVEQANARMKKDTLTIAPLADLVTTQGKITPEIEALCNQPLAAALGVAARVNFPIKSKGELVLVLKLQERAMSIASNRAGLAVGRNTRAVDETDSGIFAGTTQAGLTGLYQSPEDYTAIAEAALTEMLSMPACVCSQQFPIVEKTVYGGTETARTKRFITVFVQLTGADLLKVVQTSAARLACLAF